ncbi:F-box/FBD/LRR-repeat protein At4g00160-like isoform X2 [Carex rostrata]
MMEGGDFARDRISGLPDPLLTHILSFLPIEEAVCTCILAKRWIKVWASLPVLIFLYDPVDNLTTNEYRKLEAKFLLFVRSVISHREKITLDTFKLTLLNAEREDSLGHIFEFLCCAVECRPRVLSIQISVACTFFDLPDSICTCTSVEDMSLWFVNYDPLSDDYVKPRSINLPFLKKLELGCMHLLDDLMRMLISGCPILEELVLIQCCLEMNLISSNVLKKLVLKDCVFGGMEISCPGVVFLSIEKTVLVGGGITLKNMSSLTMVDIFLKDSEFEDTIDDLRLLSGLSNVTSLKLYIISPDTMKLLQADIPNCPTLGNLKSLELGALDFNYDWDLVVCLLQHSSNLKDLTLHFYQNEEEFQGEISFQDEYLEAVKTICPGKNVKLDEELVHNQDELLVTTAKIIIL